MCEARSFPSFDRFQDGLGRFVQDGSDSGVHSFAERSLHAGDDLALDAKHQRRTAHPFGEDGIEDGRASRARALCDELRAPELNQLLRVMSPARDRSSSPQRIGASGSLFNRGDVFGRRLHCV